MRSIDVTHLAEVAATHAPSADQDGQLHPEVIDAIHGTGLLRHFVPRERGGADGSFTDSVEPSSTSDAPTRRPAGVPP